VGGYDNNYYYKTLQIFDTVARTWSTGAELPKELFGVAVVSYAGKLYVFGGADGSTVYASTYAYNPGIDTWSSLASMPVATYAAAAAPIGTTGAILVMGGNSSLSSGSEHAVVQEYNVSSGEWALRSNMKKPRAGAGGINYGTKVFCLHGATTNDAYLADSEYYYSGTWRNIIFGSQELFMPLPGRYGNKIFSLCGHNGLNDSNNVWRFTSP
jgi:N-acetylneuraminic acid mutarotase